MRAKFPFFIFDLSPLITFNPSISMNEDYMDLSKENFGDSQEPDAGYSSGQPASDGQRIVATLIDIILAGIVGALPVIGWLASVGYMLTRDALPFLDGQSVGKKLMKLRAVDQAGQPLTENWGPAVLRNAVLFIPLFPLVELIVMLTNQDKLRLGDQWAKTRVVVEPGV